MPLHQLSPSSHKLHYQQQILPSTLLLFGHHFRQTRCSQPIPCPKLQVAQKPVLGVILAWSATGCVIDRRAFPFFDFLGSGFPFFHGKEHRRFKISHHVVLAIRVQFPHATFLEVCARDLPCGLVSEVTIEVHGVCISTTRDDDISVYFFISDN